MRGHVTYFHWIWFFDHFELWWPHMTSGDLGWPWNKFHSIACLIAVRMRGHMTYLHEIWYFWPFWALVTSYDLWWPRTTLEVALFDFLSKITLKSCIILLCSCVNPIFPFFRLTGIFTGSTAVVPTFYFWFLFPRSNYTRIRRDYVSGGLNSKVGFTRAPLTIA